MSNQMGFAHWVIVILISVMAIGLVGAALYYEINKEENITNNANTNIAIITNTITSYEECVNGGFGVIATDPPSCKARDITFTLEQQQYDKDFIVGMSDERVLYKKGTIEELLLADCEERDGTYNTCYMAPCETGTCIQVCTPVCDLI